MTVHGKYRLALLGQGNGVPLRGVIFDMDGTLTKPQTWMFAEMRKQLSVPDGVVILDYLLDIPDGPLREEAEGKIRAIEERAMHEQEPTLVLMVGDSREDMQAGLEAGCAVVLLRHEDNGDSEAAFAVEGSKSKLDGIVTDFFELYKLLQDGIVVDRI
ncbi:Phosphoglycolate phosphatase [Pichia kudriavzevii]|uniref:Phosphoglycolate phosphatase n=1 Tax=Pichia kudriavzevii TaxID=4909 RepID=A0A1V2LUI0_PICKU|nr:Phosphoglycolate phosphatase [Pichia kudriavzevii]